MKLKAAQEQRSNLTKTGTARTNASVFNWPVSQKMLLSSLGEMCGQKLS